MAAILDLLAATLTSHWFVGYWNFKFEYIFPVLCQKHAINRNYTLKFEFQDVYWWILPNFKLSGSHFELLAAILNCFACCFCVIISNLIIHDYKHVQIKQSSKNYNFKLEFLGACSKKIFLFWALWQPFWSFWQPSWIFIGSLGIKTSNLNTSFLITCQIHAISKNYNLKFEF